MKHIEPKYQGKWREERAEKGAINAFKACYYIIAWVVGYYFLRDIDALPSSLLGHGDLSKMMDEYPFWTKPAYFDLFFTASIGYHLEGFVNHAINGKGRGDYIEMFLHHAATTALIITSHLANCQKGGAIILWLHCWSDIFTSSTRMVMDIKSRARDYLYISILVTWAYTRLYIFF